MKSGQKYPLIIIKLGGSVITEKATNRPIFQAAITKRIAAELAAYQKEHHCQFIIVHGAGSFGHPIAKKYKLDQGYIDQASTLGYARTKLAMVELNIKVWHAFDRATLPVSIVQPSTIIQTKNRQITNFDIIYIKSLLEKDCIPMLFGDAVIDTKIGYAIVSGDTMVSYLAKALSAAKVIFVSDVDGVYDRNPKRYPDAHKIAEITSENLNQILDAFEVFNQADTTGEMKGKLETIQRDLSGIDVFITNGLKKKYLYETLLGNGAFSTRIHF